MSAREGFFIDLSNYRESRSDRIAEGEYLVRITDAVFGETKKGDNKVTLYYNVMGGAHNDAVLIDTLTLTEKAAFRVVNVLKALGIKVEKRNMNISFKQLIGRTLVVKVADGEPYNDEIKSEVRSYAPASLWKGYEGAPKAEEKNASNASGGSIEDEEEVDSTDASDSPPWADSTTQEEATEEHGEVDSPEDAAITL